MAERLTALAASPDGSICAGGGNSGALYAWDVASGRLLRTWPAHYQVTPPPPTAGSPCSPPCMQPLHAPVHLARMSMSSVFIWNPVPFSFSLSCSLRRSPHSPW